MQSLRWPLLFGSVLGLLIFTLIGSFMFTGIAAWSIGFVYIAYDSLLLSFMVISSQVAVIREDRRRAAGPSPLWRVHRGRRSPFSSAPGTSASSCPNACARSRPQTELADEIIVPR